VGQTESSARLLDWSRTFLRDRGIRHHSQVDNEDLAESLRKFLDIPAFVRLPDLLSKCRSLGIVLEDLPPLSDDLFALNGWYDEGAPVILLRPDQAITRYQHSLGHELREVIENAFKRTGLNYRGLDTHDNQRMNPHSDRFASRLLMPTSESIALLAQLGYDLLGFSQETSRSLPSVVVRAESLFSATSPAGPLAGAWLYEAPWPKVKNRKSQLRDLVITQHAFMNGFRVGET